MARKYNLVTNFGKFMPRGRKKRQKTIMSRSVTPSSISGCGYPSIKKSARRKQG
ncbi:hypothetical protein [uncultured Desulfovibrio sp.]|uniref:hypothetical protein n=1 Tax=uncultured Desulfovibrio sp. TaxID=167968 RepID=UPI00345D5179